MSPRLTYRTVPVRTLSEADAARMLELMHRCYEGVDSDRFRADLSGKQFVILLSDRDNGQLAGFSTIALREVDHEGRRVEVLFSGDTVIHPDYWGQKMLDTAFARFLVSRKLRRPWTPLYWLLLSGGYKTYLIIIHYFVTAFPRREHTPTASDVALSQHVCRAWFGEQFDAERGIVRMGGHYKVRTGVAPIDAKTLEHPDIAFFHSVNPGHVDGDELVCLAEVRLSELARAFVRIFTRRFSKRRRKKLPETATPGPELSA